MTEKLFTRTLSIKQTKKRKKKRESTCIVLQSLDLFFCFSLITDIDIFRGGKILTEDGEANHRSDITGYLRVH